MIHLLDHSVVERCKDVDLGLWLTETYKVPSKENLSENDIEEVLQAQNESMTKGMALINSFTRSEVNLLLDAVISIAEQTGKNLKGEGEV